MHSDVGAAVEQGGFQFLDEQSLAADLGEWPVENLIAARGHAEQFHLAGGIQLLQLIAHMLGLPECQSRLARGDDDAFRR